MTPTTSSVSRAVLSIALVAGAFAVAQGHEITFHLVPQEAFERHRESLKQVALDEGTIYLYAEGAYRPDRALTVNRPHRIPPGTWYWIGEAPGFVTVAAGSLRLSRNGEVRRSLVWPVVPACRLDLSRSRWTGVTRLDAVSLDHGSTHPVTPAGRTTVNVPAGRFLTYGVGPRGVTGISPVQRCEGGSTVEIGPPPPPGRDRQQLMVSVRTPEPEGDLSQTRDDAPQVAATLTRLDRPGSGAAPPTAEVRVGRRTTFFFVDVPATDPLRLTLSHPALMTREIDFESIGGAVREFDDQFLRERVRVDLPLDYRPGREHDVAVFRVLRCGSNRDGDLVTLKRRRCRTIDEPRLLIPGAETYAIERLDRGWYVFEAQVDDEVVLGLGDWRDVEIDERDPPVIAAPGVLLEELHIYGHLLVDDEPVPGEVRLEPYAGGTETRRFPTSEDDLLYHMYYFGHPPTEDFHAHRLAPEIRERAAELRGMFHGYLLRACDEAGCCRSFGLYSSFSGSGRRDIDLGTGRTLRIGVVDAETGDPVPDARVTTGRPPLQRPVHFMDGETFSGPEDEPVFHMNRTDDRGEVRLRNLDAGEHILTVAKNGYRRFRQPLPAEDADLEIRVELRRVEEEWDLRFVFADGVPAARSFVLALGQEGAPDYRCSAAANAFGEIEFPPECLRDPRRLFLFQHPQALLQRFSASDLAQAGELRVERAAPLPLRLRLVDGHGQPVAHAALALRFSDLTLEPNHFLASATQAGFVLPFRTDGAGRIELGFIHPGGLLPQLGIFGRQGWFAIPAPASGQTVEIVVD